MTVVAIYHIDDEETPYRAKIQTSVESITLADFKNVLKLAKNFKFFFASQDAVVGLVKEEISDDLSKLPILNGRIEAWLVSADGSSHSDPSVAAKGSHGVGSSRGAAPIENRPPSFHAHRLDNNSHDQIDQSACTSETESTISGLPKFPRHGSKLDRRSYRPQYYDRGRYSYRNWSTPVEGNSALTSELETTSFIDSEDDQTSRFSTSTDITSVSRQHLKNKRRKRRLPRTIMSRASSVSSITESSLSLNIITVTLNLEKNKVLGLSIVGHSNQVVGDGGIYVGSIMKGGAVALDGRIEAGDMILQVNDISFDNISNDEAVQIMREIAVKSDSIKLVVAKHWDPNPKSYFTIPRTEPIRPIDPGAWVAHTNALRSGADQQPPPPEYPRPSSASTASNNSGSFTSSLPESDKYSQELKLDVNVHDMQTVARAMARPDSGLEVKNRSWLKITIPNAFLGSDLVDWLYTHVHGFSDLKDARKYASKMLKDGFIKHTVNKITFASQCYYVFGDFCGNFANLRLEEPREESGSSSSEHDTVSPLLPPPPLTGGTVWPSTGSVLGQYPPMPYAPTASMASGYAPMPYLQMAGTSGGESHGMFPVPLSISAPFGPVPVAPGAVYSPHPGASTTTVPVGFGGSSGTVRSELTSSSSGGSDNRKMKKKQSATGSVPMKDVE